MAACLSLSVGRRELPAALMPRGPILWIPAGAGRERVFVTGRVWLYLRTSERGICARIPPVANQVTLGAATREDNTAATAGEHHGSMPGSEHDALRLCDATRPIRTNSVSQV